MFISSSNYECEKVFVEFDGQRFFNLVTTNKSLPEIKTILNKVETNNKYKRILMDDGEIIIDSIKIIDRNIEIKYILQNYVIYDYVPTIRDILMINEIEFDLDTKISITYIKDFDKIEKLLGCDIIDKNLLEINKLLN
jgi:hypothetical protein